MALADAQVGQQEGHRLGGHRGATVSMDRQLVRLDVLFADGLPEQTFGEFRALAVREQPAWYVPTKDVDDHVQVEVGPLGRTEQFGDVHDHTWFGPSATSSGLTVAGWVAWRRRSRTSPSARSRRYMGGTEPRPARCAVLGANHVPPA